MGQEFSFAFDIAIVVLLAIFAFVGLKRGFARVVLGLVSTAAAFALAMVLSLPIARQIYKSSIEAPIEERIDEATNEVFSNLTLGNIPDMDFSAIKISGTPVDEFKPEYAGTRKAIVELSDIDMSETGITVEDLAKIGVTDEIDLSSLNGKTAEFTMDEINRYGLGRVTAAHYIAVNFSKNSALGSLDEIINGAGNILPSAVLNAEANGTGISALRTVTLRMFDSRVSFRDAVMGSVIEPNCILVIRTLVFVVIFIVVSLALRIVAAAAKLIGKIPVIGKVNAFLGLVLGLAEGMLTVFLVCLITRMIVSLSGANSILFNQTAIDSTVLFKTFYNFDFLNFLS